MTEVLYDECSFHYFLLHLFNHLGEVHYMGTFNYFRWIAPDSYYYSAIIIYLKIISTSNKKKKRCSLCVCIKHGWTCTS